MELFVSSVTGGVVGPSVELVDGPISAVVLVTREVTVVKMEVVLEDMVVDLETLVEVEDGVVDVEVVEE